MNELVLIISSIAIILSVISGVLSFLALAYIIGLKNSTHQIERVPVSSDGDLEKLLNEDIFKDMV